VAFSLVMFENLLGGNEKNHVKLQNTVPAGTTSINTFSCIVKDKNNFYSYLCCYRTTLCLKFVSLLSVTEVLLFKICHCHEQVNSHNIQLFTYSHNDNNNFP
jgi:hypothetical protein